MRLLPRALAQCQAVTRAAAWAVVLLMPGLAAGAPQAPADPQPDDGFVHVTRPGDTLIGLGRRYLADPARWPDIQRANALRDPRRIPVGTALRIPLALMGTEPAAATVLGVRGDVRSGGVPLAAGQTLDEASEVVTAPDGQVTVRLVDGTVLRLRAQARLRVDTSRRVPAAAISRSGVELQQGRVEVDAQPARGGQPGFRIRTPHGVLGVRGTSFRVEARASGSVGEVLEGRVAVEGLPSGPRQPAQLLSAGFGVVIDADGRVAAPMALLPPPEVGGLPALHERPLVRLPMPPMPGAAAWRVQVAQDERFELLLADVRSATPELRVAGLADGRYLIRLRAVDAQGLEGRDAQDVLVLKARPEPPVPQAPVPRAELRGQRVDFSWTAGDGVRRYRLQLARTDTAGAEPFDRPLHDVRDIAATTLGLEGLPPGAYVWRVASVRADGDQGPFGDGQAFSLRPLPPAVAPPGPPTVGDHALRFFWKGLPGQRFDFQLSADPAFAILLEDRRLDSAEVELPRPATGGRYYIRLRSRDADGFVGPWSATQHVDIVACVRDGSGACVRVQGGLLQLQ